MTDSDYNKILASLVGDAKPADRHVPAPFMEVYPIVKTEDDVLLTLKLPYRQYKKGELNTKMLKLLTDNKAKNRLAASLPLNTATDIPAESVQPFKKPSKNHPGFDTNNFSDSDSDTSQTQPEQTIEEDPESEVEETHITMPPVNEDENENSEEEVLNQAAINDIIVIPLNEVKAIVAAPDFWEKYVKKLRWKDRDEAVRNKACVINALNNSRTRAELKSAINVITTDLRSELQKHQEFASLTDNEKYNFLAHIVGKGKAFFEEVLDCPSLALYLLDKKGNPPVPNYYELWDWL